MPQPDLYSRDIGSMIQSIGRRRRSQRVWTEPAHIEVGLSRIVLDDISINRARIEGFIEIAITRVAQRTKEGAIVIRAMLDSIQVVLDQR